MQAVQEALELEIQEPSTQELVSAVKVAVGEGRVAGCPSLKLPYAFEGLLRPVKFMQGCSCSMSYVAAHASMHDRKCVMCFNQLPQNASVEDVTEDDRQLLRVLRAERKNMQVPVIPSDDVQLTGKRLGWGGSGTSV